MTLGTDPSGHCQWQLSEIAALSRMASLPQRALEGVTSCPAHLGSRRTAGAGPGQAGFRGSFSWDWHVEFALTLKGSWDVPGSPHASHLSQHPQQEELGSPRLTAVLEPVRPTARALWAPSSGVSDTLSFSMPCLNPCRCWATSHLLIRGQSLIMKM